MSDSEDENVSVNAVGFIGWNVGSLSSETSGEEQEEEEDHEEDHDDHDQHADEKDHSVVDDTDDESDQYEPPSKKVKTDNNSSRKMILNKNISNNPSSAKLLGKKNYKVQEGQVQEHWQGRTAIAEASKPQDGEKVTTVFAREKSDTGSSKNIVEMEKKNNSSSYNPFSAKLMAKMGYEEGKGLGKHQQGRTGIVEASKQRGRRGLGLELKGFEDDDEATWDFSIEEITCEETVKWMPSCTDAVPNLETMKTWIKLGPKLMAVPMTSEFCSDETVQKVVECKSVFDNLENEQLRRARTKSNPFETIRGVIFQNRAAMKMANMDAILGFMFTKSNDDLLYFADICAGPGGFSEYVLWRRKCTAKGFGFTLKGSNDFKLHEFYAAPSELFEPHYGSDDDGDIYKPNNLTAFRTFVWKSTNNQGVHFVMADGGFSVEGQENLQEIRSNRLYLCQFLCALSILRTGGHFVCKLFDIFTEYSVGLIYLMYLAFDEISIFKPVTSRPANSERYIICKNMRNAAKEIHDYMFEVNLKFEEVSGIMSDQDVCEVVPLHILKSNEVFTNYIVNSSEELGRIQVLNLEKIKVFVQNPNLHDLKQAELREKCLRLWQVPDTVRTAPTKEEPSGKFRKLAGNEVIENQTTYLTQKTLQLIHSRYDYKFVVLGEEERLFLLSCGRSQVFMWNGVGAMKWEKLFWKKTQVNVEIPRDTLLEVELVHELKGEGKGQRKTVAIHIIDALVIYGENLRDLSYELRISRARVFCKAVNKPTRTDIAEISVKDQYDLCDLHEYFDRLEDMVVKGMGPRPQQCYKMQLGRHFVPRGLLMIKIVKEPWMLAHSKSSGKVYYYNTMSKKSVYEFPLEARLSYKDNVRERCVWYYPKESKQTCVSEDELIAHLHSLSN